MKKKYEIESTTEGFPELERALFKAHEKIGWKSLTSFIVNWTNKHQPKDTSYCLLSWEPKKSLYKPPKMIRITEKEYKELKSKQRR